MLRLLIAIGGMVAVPTWTMSTLAEGILKQTRQLWRMQGPRRVVAAALYTHPGGTELRVYFEPEDRNDVLETRVERFDVGLLEQRAEALASILREKGWWPLALSENAS